ncbi:MAG: hypothetical protein HDT20_06250 [Oscillibacter sp.]|nr:hypothetical protein [Oscillibacter sp.]
MSASREKKKRQEFLASGAVDPKAARAAEQKAAERKSNIIYGTVAGLFVVVAIALFVYNSGIIQRNQTAVTIDGEKYTVAETAYYYNQVCSNYASFFGQEYLQTLKTQPHPTDEGKTYDDYFKESAVDNMKYIHAATTAAKAANISLDSDDEATVKANVDNMKTTAASAGYSYGTYLKAVYGSTMTNSVFESCLRDQILASKYAAKYSEDNFVYSDDEILSYYEEHKETYDIIDGAYVAISGAPEEQTDDQGNVIEATDAEKAAALSAAEDKAEKILNAYKSSKDLESAASASDATVSTSISSSATTYGAWFFDEARKDGDADVIEDADNSYVYVVVFNSRQRDDSPATYDVRHILVTSDNLGLPEGEEATDEQIKAKADEILASWDGTVDGFAKLANEHSQDGGSNTNGGLYEGVGKNEMVAAFENWCYEDGRQAGDTGIVQSSYGYHIMYFVGYGSEQYWHYACDNALRSTAESDWQTSLIEGATAEINESGMKNVG